MKDLKRLAILITVLTFLFTLCACSTQQSENSSDSAQENLEIGDTAKFSDYSITLNSIVPRGENRITANITVSAKEDMTFRSKYFDVYSGDKKLDGSDINLKENITSGDSYSATLTFPNKNIDGLGWDQDGNKAMWRFDTITTTQGSNVYDRSLAMEVLQEYGEKQYPKGFELRLDDESTTESMLSDTECEFIIPCRITDENGTAQDKMCTAIIDGIGVDLSNYTVTQFNIN